MKSSARLLGLLLLVTAPAGPAAAQKASQPAGPPISPFLEARFRAFPARGPAPLEVTFLDRSLGNVTSWRWEFGDGAVSHAASPRHTYVDGGFYTVRLTVRRSDGRTDTLEKPDGVIVSACPAGSVRENRSSPLELGQDFVPVTGDDRLGFYVVYSGKAQSVANPAPANNVGLFLFPLAGDEVLLFGSGYGDANSLVQPTGSAAWDVQRIDGLIRFCLGGAPGRTRVRFVAPHGHIDHINADCIRELRRRGYQIPEITFHVGDAGAVQSLPGWTPADQAVFRVLQGTTGQCQEELASYASPLGKLWLYSRPGHTPGSIDLAIDIGGDPTNRLLVRGSAAIFGSCPIPNTREAIDPHGNIQLGAIPPALDSVSPAHASSLGNTSVSLFGSGFASPGAGTVQVLVDGVLASAVTVHDDGALTCRIPAGLPGAAAEVRVLTRNGADTFAGALTYRPLPTLLAVEPDHGLTGGGTRLTLRGTGFQSLGPGPCTVRIGAGVALSVTVLDDRTLECTSPPGAVGAVDVRLENLNGSALLPGAFRIDPEVALTDVTPLAGTSLGGLRVLLRGQHFAVGNDLPRVFFGPLEAPDVVRVDDTLLECTLPPGPSGARVDVRVSAENGSHVLPSAFRYFLAPEVTEVQPADGPARGGDLVTVRGLAFTRNSAGPCTVRFDGLEATGVSLLSDGVLRCTVPAGTSGTSATVEVANANGSGSLAESYRYHRVPQLVGLQPERGTHLGGTLVTLQAGALLEAGSGPPLVSFGAAAATQVEVLDDGTLRCRTPLGSPNTSVDVRLANANGEARLPEAFRYVVAPVAAALSPAIGTARGGDTLTLVGSGFQSPGAGLPVLRLGNAPATAVRVLDDAHLTFESPAGPPGRKVGLVLENAFGSTRLDRAFRYRELPTLAALEPSGGPVVGGAEITVLGSGFLTPGAGVPRLVIGGRSATGVQVRTDGRLTCLTPPGEAGAVDVRLATRFGDALLSNGFTYGSGAPHLAALTPASGSSQGGQRVTLTGSGFGDFQSTTRVFFGSNEAGAVRVSSDRLLTCDAPPGVPGTSVDVEVRRGNQSTTLPGAWRVHPQPSLTSVAPPHGSALGGQTINLRGTGFLADEAGVPRVTIGALEALAVTVLDDTRLSCRTPGGPAGATVDVRLENANGNARLVGAYRHHSAPTLTAIAPVAGASGGGTEVTLTGSGFGAGATPEVRFGGLAAASVSVLDDTTLTCRTPASSPGTVPVSVVTPDGEAARADGFRFYSAPVLQALAPDSGSALGGMSVLLTGQGFLLDVAGPTTVTFDGVASPQVSALDDGRVQALAPAGPAGLTVRVELTNANGTAALDGFRYHARPEVLAVTPASGPGLGNTLVTLHGSGFRTDAAGANAVFFGATPAAAVTVIDDVTLTCRSPAGTPGESPRLRVVNANGDSLPGPVFRFSLAPSVHAVVPSQGYSGATTTVELTGAGFLNDAPGLPEVQFGTRLATEVSVLDDTRLVCRAPAGSTGAVTVRVRTANGLGTLPEAFFYDWEPTLLAVTPATGSALGGAVVELAGAGFALPEAGALSVRFGANTASAVQVLAGDRLRCVVPPGPAGTAVALSVSNAHGSSSLPGAWRYHARPTLTSVSPPQGAAGGGTTVTLRGSGFSAGAAGPPSVSFGGAPATDLVVTDDGTLTCVTPAGAARTAATIVLGNANGSTTLQDGFRWTGRAQGDLNDDGLVDLVVGGDESVVVFFSGAPLGFRSSAEAGLRLVNSAARSLFGAQTVSADLDDDGFIDLVVAAPEASPSGNASGAAYVYFGPLAPAALPRSPADADAVLTGQASQDRFGSALAVADLDGDGRTDLLVGAPGDDGADTDAGAVLVFLGQSGFASRAAAQADARYTGARGPDAFGSALATGDIDGDGIADLVVGAPFHKDAGSSSGAVYLFPGTSPLVGRPAQLATAEIGGERSGDQFGTALALGDLDGDGLDDLVVGAPEANRGSSAAGGVYVLLGSAPFSSRTASAAAATYDGEDGGDRLGRALAMGDLDGDGILDLLLGAPQHDLPNGNSGRAYSIRGGALFGGPILARAHTVFTAENSSSDLFGQTLAALDLDGDGRAEALVAAPFNNGLGSDSGRVYLFAGPALATRAAQGADGMFTGASTGMALGLSLGRLR